MKSTLAWQKGDGLLPAIVQDADTATVLMLAYMSPESLAITQETGKVTFFSRSRQRLWTKGESSGNELLLVDIKTDCDSDTLLIFARPTGPVCHRGTANCFDTPSRPGEFIHKLETIISTRAAEKPETSYTADLLASGIRRMAQKVGEEGVEVALAAGEKDAQALVDESADLLYHLLVLLHARGLSFDSICARLQERHEQDGR